MLSNLGCAAHRVNSVLREQTYEEVFLSFVFLCSLASSHPLLRTTKLTIVSHEAMKQAIVSRKAGDKY